MKKFYKYLLLIISLLLSSCNDEAIYFNYDEMIDKVTKSVGDHTKSADVFADTRKAIGDAIEERFNDQ